MALIEVVVCDVCREVGKPTRTYTLARDDDEPVEKVLCSRHGAPLDALLEAEAPAAPQAREPAARRRRRTTPVVTLEEIEARKAAASS